MTSSCCPRAARVRNTRIAEQTRAPTHAEREPALQGNDRVHSPSADDFIGNRTDVTCKLLALAHREIQDAREYEALGNIKSIQASFSAKVIRISITPTSRGSFQPVDCR